MGHSCFRLERSELVDLIAEAQADPTDNTSAMNEIVRRFDRLAIKIAYGLTGDVHLQQELGNTARAALVRAVRRHDLAQVGFPAYAERFMRGAALRAWKRSRSMGNASIDVIVVDFTDPEAERLIARVVDIDPLGAWGGGTTERAIAGLTPDQQDLLAQRYLEDASLNTIAERSGTSVSAVSQRLDTAHRTLARVLAA